jgi:prevent-host-death family protein
MLKTTERIITITDLQHDPDTVVRNAQKRPLVITAEGRPAAYVLGVEMFDALMEQLLELEREELIANIGEGKKQFDSGDYLTLKEAVAAAETVWQAQEPST